MSLLGMGAAAPAPAGSSSGSGLPDDLLTQDYGAYVLTEQDVATVPGLRQGKPYSADAPAPVPSGQDIAACGEPAGSWSAGAHAEVVGTAPVENALAPAVINEVGAVDDAKATFGVLRALAKSCTDPYADGQLAPAARQPKVKKAGDGIAALAINDLRPPASTTYLLYVREGEYFLSVVVVGLNGVDASVKNADIDRLAKRTAANLADLAREARRS